MFEREEMEEGMFRVEVVDEVYDEKNGFCPPSTEEFAFCLANLMHTRPLTKKIVIWEAVEVFDENNLPDEGRRKESLDNFLKTLNVNRD